MRRRGHDLLTVMILCALAGAAGATKPLDPAAKARRAVGRSAARVMFKEAKAGKATFGLGTGRTVNEMVLAAGKLFAKDAGLRSKIRVYVTSAATAKLAREQGFTVLDEAESIDPIDVAFDGADEVDPRGNAIKGGGGAHRWERAVARRAARFYLIMDDGKLAKALGGFPVPVELYHKDVQGTVAELAALRVDRKKIVKEVKVRRQEGGALVLNDNGRPLVDLVLTDAGKALLRTKEGRRQLSTTLRAMPHVEDHGLFLRDRRLHLEPYATDLLVASKATGKVTHTPLPGSKQP